MVVQSWNNWAGQVQSTPLAVAMSQTPARSVFTLGAVHLQQPLSQVRYGLKPLPSDAVVVHGQDRRDGLA
jgi:hypothetical protein